MTGADRPRALDLFCGAGGVSKGLADAGFDVVGVDIRPQPRYVRPGSFVQADALHPPFDLTEFDFIWASPPCQAYSAATNVRRRDGVSYPDLVAPTRSLLSKGARCWAIENVPGAPLRVNLRLNGWMFPPLRVIRERWFELSFFTMAPGNDRPRGLLSQGYMSVAGHGTQGWAYKRGIRFGADDMRLAMGIDWMTRNELSQAIPPAYAEFIGRAALLHLGIPARAAA